LRISQDKEIGLIFYKNRRFVFGNQIAHSLIHINPNTHDGHPLTKVIKQLAHEVTAYQSSQKQFAVDAQGNKLVLLGVPSLESTQSIIIVYRPEISDIITRQIDQLYNPTEWDYLLYLETTQSGKLINQLIPGTGETLLNFKVSLLKIALSGSAILLELPENDVQPTVELIHHISLRTELSVLDLKKKDTGLPISMKLFGVNPLFGMGSTKPLLEQLDKVGTLFIKNVELLDLETQQLLAEFIKYGEFRLFKGEKKKASNVRIICSTHQNIGALVAQGRFSKELFDELNKTSLAMPSLTSLSEQELNELTDGFTQQALKTNEITSLYQLTSREKNKIMHERPLSLHDLKSKIEEILHEKSTQDKQYEETDINPALETDDPDVMRAVNYGKKALKDRTMMKMLWRKFKNQNKIAAMLSVNRSSVNRRCKEYGLH
jgi:hypothetical protein